MDHCASSSLLAATLAAVFLSGCGYISDPLPPLLNIPQRVEDLAVVQRGGLLIAQFTVPRLSTEKAVLKRPVRAELYAGAGAPGGAALAGGVAENGRVRYEVPVDGWAGKEVVFGVKAVGANGRDAGWSNLVTVQVVPPPQQPADVRAEPVRGGVRLTWHAAGGRFRVFRRAGEQTRYAPVADVTAPQWTDTSTQYGTTYSYLVQTIVKTRTGEAESEPSAVVAVTPRDVFPPAAPAGLTAVPAAATVELIWERSNEPDVAGYRVYRAAGQAPFVKISGVQPAPSYSDRDIQSGMVYRYAVSAVSKAGVESPLSAPVQATAP